MDTPWLPSLGGQDEKKYLPIELMRSQAGQQFLRSQLSDEAACFLSSGSTSQSRARSYFSARGLALYRRSCLTTFRGVLQAVLPHDSCHRPLGITLVPPPSIWPDSSLSQMLHWFSEEYPLVFVSAENCSDDLTTAIAKHAHGQGVWIFATAFHLIAAFDRGLTARLPAGSVVFETGGSKGRSRSLDRQELYALISSRFGIPPTDIVSEYSMAELCAQAYDWVPRGAGADFARHFRFPPWVKVEVIKACHLSENSGTGSLVVADPRRVDYPWPMRIQDIVKLKADGSFSLCGRTPKSPLKGCSLGAEDLLDKSNGASGASSFQLPSFTSTKHTVSTWKGTFLEECLFSVKSHHILSAELGSKQLANATLADLRRAMPSDNTAWQDAVKRSQIRPNTQWLIISSGNHSLAALYPVVIALMGGANIYLRIPKSLASKSLLSYCAAWLEESGAPIITLSDTLRITSSVKLKSSISAILAFGEDHTLKHLERLADVPVYGFGSRLSVLVCSDVDSLTVENIAKSAMSLGQRGCRSTRLVVYTGNEKELGYGIRKLADSIRRSYGRTPDCFAQAALDHEEIRYRQLGAKFFHRRLAQDPLLPCLRTIPPQAMHELLSLQSYVLPVIYGPAATDWKRHLATAKDLPLCVSTPKENAHLVNWDGSYEGYPLFSRSDKRLRQAY